MKKTETDKMIDTLVRGLNPVRVTAPLSLRLVAWGAAAVVLIGAFLVIVGVRRELDVLMSSWRLLLDAALVVVLALVASSSALRLSVPGEERSVDRILPLGVLATWAVVTGSQIVMATSVEGVGAFVPDRHYTCAALVTSLAAVLSVPLTGLLRRAAPMDRWWCGGLAGLAAGASAMVGIELVCVFGRPAHLMMWHVIPVIVFAAAGFLLGPRLLAPKTK